LKRASESVQLYLDGGDRTAKAKDLLKFAGERVDEAHGLASRASATALGGGVHAGTIDSHTADLIASTLSSADSDVRDATSLLAKEAVASKSSSPLQILTDWAPSQLARLKTLADVMPAGDLREQAQSSLRLVNAAADRAEALAPVVASGCAPAASDELGPDPTGSCIVEPVPTQSSSPTAKPTESDHQGGGPNTGPGVNPVTSENSSQPDPQHTTTSPSPSKPPIQLPTIITIPPLPTPDLPVSSCGVHLTLGPLPPINLGSCSSSP
jgi:hypothetical protein